MRSFVAALGLAAAALFTVTACSNGAAPGTGAQPPPRQAIKAAAAPADPADPEQRAAVPADALAKAGSGSFEPIPPAGKDSEDGGTCQAVDCPPSDTEPPVTCTAIECEYPGDYYTFGFGDEGLTVAVDVPIDFQPIERDTLWYDFRDSSEQFLLRVRAGGVFDGDPQAAAWAQIERLSGCAGFELIDEWGRAAPGRLPQDEAYEIHFRYERDGEPREARMAFIGTSDSTSYLLAGYAPEDRGPYMSEVLANAFESLEESDPE